MDECASSVDDVVCALVCRIVLVLVGPVGQDRLNLSFGSFSFSFFLF